LGRYAVDNDEKKIVCAVLHSDERRRKRITNGKGSPFDKQAAAAVDRAKERFDIPDTTQAVRDEILRKVIRSLADRTPWEKIGETYCCRELFYKYRKQFLYLCAVELGLRKRTRQQERKGGGHG